MSEKPILFSGLMVKAILDGSKTQTRRIVTDQSLITIKDGKLAKASPRNGGIGDCLWVKETFRFSTADDCACYDPCGCRAGTPIYRATCGPDKEESDPPWKPSIFMPRKASRITLEITNVRVERLNEISEADAQCEGCERPILSEGPILGSFGGMPMRGHPMTGYYVDAFETLWESINGKGSWAENPWVWVIEFKKL